MNSNIPVKQTKQILDNMLKSNRTNAQTNSELLNWYDVVTKQNYFQHNSKTIIQTNGFAMVAPSSGIISEIFLHILNILISPTERRNTN